MEKLLHERLREMADGIDCDEPRRELGYEVDDEHGKRECAWCSKGALEAIADEIKRYYIPRPRFEDGETVVKGSETDFGTVWSVGARDDGYWRLFDEDGVELCCGEKGEFVKRPTLKVCDADGVEIKVGDTVYRTDDGTKWEVLKLHESEPRVSVRQLDTDKNVSGGWFLANEYTHERPVFDAEGVRICNGDTVYDERGRKMTVQDIQRGYASPVGLVDCETGNHLRHSYRSLYHREPDSLEKLRDDIRDAYENWAPPEIDGEWIARLTALIERGA